MTVLMPTWYYDKKDLKCSPSILDGIDPEKESRYRREGARFIINVGTKMGLRYDTMATGVVYFHRFYMFHSFITFPRYVTACCCLFLAGKVEETPKKCKDIIRIAKTFLADSQFAQFGDDPKEEVMTLERILLQTIKFDLQMDHPYGYLLKYAKCLKGDKVKLQNMVQMAWTFINDSLCTTLCLQFEPEIIAIALMYLAGKLSKFEVVDWVGRTPRFLHWWDMFVEGMSIQLLEDICHQVLDLYSAPALNASQDSPPATPPTKSSRKSSQPPSPVEASTSPAQTKPKEVAVGLPIPRLEPGEFKRKASMSDPKKELLESKKRLATEGKAIPVIASSPPKAIITTTTESSDTQPSSPTSPNPAESTVKSTKLSESSVQRTATEATFITGITNQEPFSQSAQTIPVESVAAKPVPTVPVTSFPPTVPPPTTTFTQPGPPFYTGVSLEKNFPNIQQPPPQIYPLQFQHPPPGPPPPTPTGPPPPPGMHPPTQFGDPSHQFPAVPPNSVPPFNSQFPPPPPRQPPPLPPNINNPPPAPIPGLTQHPPPPRPQGLPPVPGMIRSLPPPGLPNVRPRPPRMMPDGPFGPKPPGTDVFNPRPDQRGVRFPPGQDFGPRPRFDGDHGYRRRKDPDFDGLFPHEPPFSEFDQGFPRHPPPNQFGPNFERPPRPPMPPRRFPLDPNRKERGPRPPMGNNSSQSQGAPTGIPPVRITGRY